ncbi:magnesium transporter [Alkalilimnicola ehrlichii MLHE-1]|uniref:Magnesium transporter MgtE n=1 Tax=Alkalilimnicola ehrlichii (strain ATCC BAA-1101 / DSM 17681 / MLHE-1) TaxID=187272 RepID=Q0AAF9_ALKEH|nr:magnesium transporter [Alkalilimnicola ehrlichii]ABI56178.1 magnesium transporter [Alkalilimnicola ehrlichii MLHE-1]
MQEEENPLVPRIQAALAERRWSDVREAVADEAAQDIADIMLELEKAERIFLFKLLPRHQANEVFAYLSPDNQDALLEDMTDEETREVLASLTPDDRTALLQELPATATQRLLEMLPPGDRRRAQRLLGYPDESVGRLMTPEYISVRPNWTIEQALAHIRAQKERGETVNVIHVTDNEGKLLDALSIRRFILAEPDSTVESIMDYRYICVSAFDDREKAVETVQHYDLSALPVVDSEGVLLGIVTLDDVMDVAEAEATEDFHKLGSVGVLNLGLKDASLWALYQRRVGWLVLLVFINMFGGEIIGAYEDTLAAVIVLVTFLPLVVDTAGNAGTQSATLMVRGLATGDVKSKDWLKLWSKEAMVSVALGVTLAVAVAFLGMYRGGMEIAYVVALSMVAVVFMGSMIGMLLPFILARFKLDPATASAPLITSIADIFGILIYFAIATAMLDVTGVTG